MSDQSVRFVSHEATRTGAPLALLRFQRWLRIHTEVRFETLCLADGPLLADFATLGPTWVDDAVSAAAAPLPPTIFLNSAASLPVIAHLPFDDLRIIGHVHELEVGQRWALAGHDANALFSRLTRLVAVADCVTEALVRLWGVEADRVERIGPPVVVDDLGGSPSPPPGWAKVGITDDAVVVGGCGSIGWRKGTDLFVELVRRLVDQEDGRPVHGVWVGAGAGGTDFAPVNHDVQHAGLEDRLHFVGDQSQPSSWFRRFDVLALTSRDDPMPLVMAECALAGVPTVCFQGAGGVPEMIERSRPAEIGWAVPFLDLDAMTTLIRALVSDRARLTSAARAASAVVKAELAVDVVGPRLAETLGIPRRTLR